MKTDVQTVVKELERLKHVMEAFEMAYGDLIQELFMRLKEVEKLLESHSNRLGSIRNEG